VFGTNKNYLRLCVANTKTLKFYGMDYLNDQPLKIVALQGSIRPDNYTAKALAVINCEAQTIPGLDFEIIDPTGLDLPLPGQPKTNDVDRLQLKVREADGVILATPEYHGSYSSVIKLVVDNLGFPSVLTGKPTALLGVAAGRIGAIKALEHLRSVASHLGAHVLPQGISIANVRDLFDEKDQLVDAHLKKLVAGVLKDLIKYLSQNNSSAARIWSYSNN
jgi:FMN reductase